MSCRGAQNLRPLAIVARRWVHSSLREMRARVARRLFLSSEEDRQRAVAGGRGKQSLRVCLPQSHHHRSFPVEGVGVEPRPNLCRGGRGEKTRGRPLVQREREAFFARLRPWFLRSKRALAFAISILVLIPVKHVLDSFSWVKMGEAGLEHHELIVHFSVFFGALLFPVSSLIRGGGAMMTAACDKYKTRFSFRCRNASLVYSENKRSLSSIDNKQFLCLTAVRFASPKRPRSGVPPLLLFP